MPIQFTGGPLDGQGTMTDEEMDEMGGPMGGMTPPGGPMAGPGGPPPGGPPPPAAGGDEAAMFRSLLDNIRGLLSMNTLSEQNKLALEKASTLVQQIKASEEKDEEAAMTGKLNPGVMRRMSGGPGY
jgi:hypothetical protein